jgi:AcrR family transcriptional regulator
MATKRPLPAQRKPRADAERNRDRVLEVAKEAFTRSGADASLDDIAKQAGVGAGTLYRHFPSREALIEAVYRAEVEKLAATERNFTETMTPIEALRSWMLLFVDYIATKKIIAPALNALVGDPKKVFEASYSQIWEAIRALVKRAIKSGDIRKDLDPIDLLRALIGVSSSPDWQQSPGDWWIFLSQARGRSNRSKQADHNGAARNSLGRPAGSSGGGALVVQTPHGQIDGSSRHPDRLIGNLRSSEFMNSNTANHVFSFLQSFEPPSTRTLSPVIQRASSDARKATTGPISSGRARRWIACMFNAYFCPASVFVKLDISVSTTPGATALTRIPRGPSAAAKCFTSVSIAPFVAA